MIEKEFLCEMDSTIKTAEAKLEYLTPDAETIALYRGREAALHERANMISSAKEEGLVEGLAKGETKSKLEIARNLLLMGMGIRDIAKVTGLAETDINQLQLEQRDSAH
ncbi:MAG TPA: hypothetical protein VHY08_09340 [Bacillota bacterium]|nr:hypothetical protein [Bacillota bacterium]